MLFRDGFEIFRRAAAMLVEPVGFVLLFIAIFGLILLVVPDAATRPALLLGIALWLAVLLIIVWGLARFARENMHNLLAVLGLRPAKASPVYVRALFDSYADTFDEHIMVDLAYVAPNLLRGIVEEHVTRPMPLVVDLGCGTGICGPLFRPLAESLIGVDLSSEMLAKAEARDIYDDLVNADLVAFLSRCAGKPDLCLAADVFVYVGDLEPAFAAAVAALASGGYFAFTVETTQEPGWNLQRSGRYCHNRDYVRDAALKSGLEIVTVEEAVIRENGGQPVMGDVWLLRH